jgi:hypothetical protein
MLIAAHRCRVKVKRCTALLALFMWQEEPEAIAAMLLSFKWPRTFLVASALIAPEGSIGMQCKKCLQVGCQTVKKTSSVPYGETTL